jgi:hypothetical protein
MKGQSDRWLLAAVSVLAAGVTFLLFGFRYLPSVDFPQHVAQLSAWVHIDDPGYGFSQQFEINRTTPYLLGYLLARPFVSWLGVIGALKLVILFAALANVGAYALLLRTVEQDIWLSLLGFPLTFGFCFYFGFLNFLLATPLIVAAATLALRYGRQPHTQGALLVAAVLATTLLTHGLAFIVATYTALAVYVGERGRCVWRSVASLWPFAVPTLVAAPWLLRFGSTGVSSEHPYRWTPREFPSRLIHEFTRILEFPATLLAFGPGDSLAAVFGLCLVLAAMLSLSRYSSAWHRWTLYGVGVWGYLLAPFEVLGVAFLYERFASLVVPGMMLLAGSSAPVLAAERRRPIVVLLSLAWLAILFARVHAFNVEARDFDAAVASLPPRLRVRPLVVAKKGEVFPGLPVYLHFPAYYQAKRGGYLGYSFARYSVLLMRYRPGVDPGMAEDEEWKPALFDASREVPRYDCFMIRAESDVEPSFLRDTPSPIRLAAHVGRWWIYRTEN